MAGPIMQRVLRQVYEESQLWCLAFGDVYGLKLAGSSGHAVIWIKRHKCNFAIAEWTGVDACMCKSN